MKILDRARSALTAFSAAWSGPGNVEQWPSIWRIGNATNAGVRVDNTLAQTLSAVWACVSLRADLVAQCPIGLFKRDGDTVNRVESGDHAIAALLDRGFNSHLSTMMGIYSGETQVGIGGNSYFAIERDSSGVPQSLHLLDPYATCPRLAENVPYDVLQDYETRYQGRQYIYEPNEIVHIKGYTSRGIIGQSPLTAAREALGLSLALEKYGAKFFANDSRSGGYIIQPADLNAKAKRDRQANVATGDMGGQGGPDMAHAPKILDPGSKYVPVTISQADSQFLESRAFQIAEVCRFYRTPEVLLNSGAATSWGSGIEQLMIGFVGYTINPCADRWQDELGRKLLTPQEQVDGYYIDLDTNVLILADTATRYEAKSKAITAGWYLRNEARKSERLNPVPGLDKPVIGVNMQDGSDVKAAAQPATNQQEDGQDEAAPDSDE